MSVWLCIPSCRPASEAAKCLDRWREMGYKIAVLRQGETIEADLVIPTGDYLGWARSTNILAREVLRRDRDPHLENQWIVGGGDDCWPDPQKDAVTIAEECSAYFSNNQDPVVIPRAWYGVMQPTGDRWGETQTKLAAIDQFAGSPWMGREWCERSYLGDGPMWDGYTHCFADNEIQAVAEKQGVFWQRRDLKQFHDHPARADMKAYRQGHLAPLYHGPTYRNDFRVYEERKRRGFPGSEPCSK